MERTHNEILMDFDKIEIWTKNFVYERLDRDNYYGYHRTFENLANFQVVYLKSLRRFVEFWGGNPLCDSISIFDMVKRSFIYSD